MRTISFLTETAPKTYQEVRTALERAQVFIHYACQTYQFQLTVADPFSLPLYDSFSVSPVELQDIPETLSYRCLSPDPGVVVVNRGQRALVVVGHLYRRELTDLGVRRATPLGLAACALVIPYAAPTLLTDPADLSVFYCLCVADILNDFPPQSLSLNFPDKRIGVAYAGSTEMWVTVVEGTQLLSPFSWRAFRQELRVLKSYKELEG